MPADEKGAPAVDFQREIRPILSDNCFLCHGPDKSTRMVDLRLDIREGAFSQRKNGTPIVPGKPAESLAYRKITAENPALRMPPPYSHKSLTDKQKDTLKRWIEQGANWKEHWAFAAPVRPNPPAAQNAEWARSPIDRFILAKLEASGLKPAPEADRRTLIRRVTLDLTGLPPTPQAVAEFVNDKSDDAYAKLVDRLLESPQYGEHRAHYWLDAARYGDTNGMHYDNRRDMWPYRDWVVEAFNRNLPFDRFVVEQIAGDLLPNRTLDQQIASGFNRNGVSTNENGIIEDEVAAMYVKDRVDTTGTVFLGLTIACATCHDHKFDPISQRDYYSLAAFFRNTTQMVMDDNRPDAPPMIFVPKQGDRARWAELNKQRESLVRRMTEVCKTPNAAFDRWLASNGHRQVRATLDGSSQLLALYADDAARVSSSGVNEIKLPTGVTLGDFPAGGQRALKFDGKSALTLPNLDSISGDEPFSISTWVYLPKVTRHPGLTGSRDAPAIASKLSRVQPAPKPKPEGSAEADDSPGPPKLRGWTIDLDEGVPALRLYGDDGKTMRALALRNEFLKEGEWTHLTFTYDGSRQEQGLSLFVNGNRVPIERGGYGVQNNNVVAQLEGTLKNDAPLLFGSDGASGFLTGSIADFRVFNRVITEEEARRVAAWPTIAGTQNKEAGQLSDSEKEALKLYYLSRDDAAYQALAAEFDKVNAEHRLIENRSDTALVMEEKPDSKPVAYLLNRGMYDQPREELNPNVPSVLPPMAASYPRNRLGLAEWLVDPANPLTARVAVNRFWQELFGTGIVKTSEDFGSQGEMPSHPELLDWLAVEFRDSGWDVKNLFRLMVTSATYRQSALATEEKIKKDPDNRLLARGPRFRMDGEMVRDYALAASGLLLPIMGGPSVKPYQPAGVWEVTSMMNSNTRVYKQDSGPNLYRRSLYTLWKRSAPPASLEIFGAPTRETCIMRRERTDTPLQALVTMDDPQFVEAARHLAEMALLASRDKLDAQIDFMTSRVLSRAFEPRERQVVVRSYKNFLGYYDSHQADASKLLAVGESKANAKLPVPEFAALTMVANQLLNLDEALNK